MARTKFSFVDILCLLPNEWKDNSEDIIKMTLSSEFQYHLHKYQTLEGLVVCIDGVNAESRGHCQAVWFRKDQEEEVQPDLLKYYPLEIRVHEAVEMSRL